MDIPRIVRDCAHRPTSAALARALNRVERQYVSSAHRQREMDHIRQETLECLVSSEAVLARPVLPREGMIGTDHDRS